MSEPTGFALSRHLTDLIGRNVQFKLVPSAVETPAKVIFGIYTVLPEETPVVVKTDLSLLASFAGVLVGLPDAEVKNRISTGTPDELLRDAMHEVLNVTSTVITTEGRAVFQRMVNNVAYVDGPAGQVLKLPGHRTYFNVTVDGYQGGRFYIFSPLAQVRSAA